VSTDRVLFLLARPPIPQDTGAKIRSWNILRGFAERYEVDVLSYSEPGTALDGGSKNVQSWAEAAKEVGVRRVEEVPNESLVHPTSAPHFVAAVLQGLPVSVMKYRRRVFSGAFRKMLSQGYELLHVETLHLAGELKALKGKDRPFVTLNAHNVECQIADRMCEIEPSPLRRTALSLHARNMRRFEREAFAASDAVLAVSREDCRQIDALCDVAGRAFLVENGVDDSYFMPGEFSEENPDEVVFVGSMDWLPNIDGVVRFAEDILPRIRERRPATHLTVVGRRPHPEILALHAPDRGVTVTGTVDDVRPYVRRAGVVAVPLRFGGGTRLKILEAFSMSKAVVSTSLGCEGILCRDGDHLMVRDDAESFARACLEIMEDPQCRKKLGIKGRELALARYAWPSVIERMHAEIDRRRNGVGHGF